MENFLLIQKEQKNLELKFHDIEIVSNYSSTIVQKIHQNYAETIINLTKENEILKEKVDFLMNFYEEEKKRKLSKNLIIIEDDVENKRKKRKRI